MLSNTEQEHAMSRVDRRRFQKEFATMMESAPDACGICGKPFPHNSKTFGGFSRRGMIALAGECCQTKMQETFASGLYVSKNFDHLPRMNGESTDSSATEEDANSAVDVIQSHFKHIDSQAEKIAARAGIRTSAPPVFLSDSPWKADDAAWFKSRPDRSHRLRSMFEGEIPAAHPLMLKVQTLGNHRVEILVRQVEVGKRVRTAFARNLSISIPDVEQVAHAIFDLVAQPGREGVLSVLDVVALAEKYGSFYSGRPS
jgi:hypothetical protein